MTELTLDTSFPVAPLGLIAACRPSNVDKNSEDDEQPVRLCNYTDIYYNHEITGGLDFMTATATLDEIASFQLREGDLVITKDSETPDDIAIPALIAEDIEMLVLGYHTTLIRPDRSLVDPRYLYWVFGSRQLRAYFEARARGVTRFGLRISDVTNAPIPLPELKTQRWIAQLLDEEAQQLRHLTAGLSEQDNGQRGLLPQFVYLLREHQEALIAAAVAGQLATQGAG